MNPRHLVPFLLLAAGCGGASEAPGGNASATPPSTTVAAAPSPMGQSIIVEIVAIDASAPSLTVREGDVPALQSPGPNNIKPTDRTIRVEPGAVPSLTGLKTGQRVRVTCSAASAVAIPAGGTSAGEASSPGTLAAAPPSGPPPDLARCDSIVGITPLEAVAP
jgi:hypothetical protein